MEKTTQMTPDNYELPKNWGKDHFTKFVEEAHFNIIATAVNLKNEYTLIKDIDNVCHAIVDNLNYTRDWFSGFFFLRLHSSFLGAASLSMSGQIPETFMLLRGCLENALYGFYMSRVSESKEIWLLRHDDEESQKRMKNEFKIRNLFDCLEKENSKIYNITQNLYKKTIDWGAHPNERALSSVLKESESNGNIHFKIDYLTDNKNFISFCCKSVAQVGLCSLHIFNLIWPQRLEIMGINDQIKRLDDRLINI